MSGDATADANLEELVKTLLFEGYALYPYTPGATKNATPTPFGIVYPPVYAAGSPSTYDLLRLQVIVETDPASEGPAPTLAITALFLEPAGERHEGVERRIELAATPLAALAAEPQSVPFAFDAVRGDVTVSAQTFHDGLVRVTATIRNTTEVEEGLDRPGALRASLLSTHVVARVAGAHFISPISPPEHAATANMACANVNTFPVLATPGDDAILAAAIMLPDHPQIAPESRGDLFDGTEIEEALLLHLLALSDGEREEIAEQDPAVREMLRRAIQTTPDEFARLRGRVIVSEAGSDPSLAGAPQRAGVATADGLPLNVPRIGDELRGEREIVIDGVMYRLGDHVRLRPAPGRNAQDHLLDGRPATIERIYLDYEDAVHLCVTVDDDPGQELMRDIGRYLYFKPAEVEVIA